jgi:hypothetical protein
MRGGALQHPASHTFYSDLFPERRLLRVEYMAASARWKTVSSSAGL